MNKEIWKDIPEYERLYQVSNYGNVKCLNYHKSKKSKILKVNKDKDGYLRIVLTKNKIRKTKYVSRLVAQAFIPNPNSFPFVNHKDENKINNKVENLEWCSREYNNNYGTRSYRAGQSQRKKVFQYDKHYNLINEFNGIVEATEKTNILGSHISEVCNGKRKTAGGYIWMCNTCTQN